MNDMLILGNLLDPALTLFGATACYFFTLNKLPNSLETLRQLAPRGGPLLRASADENFCDLLPRPISAIDYNLPLRGHRCE